MIKTFLKNIKYCKISGKVDENLFFIFVISCIKRKNIKNNKKKYNEKNEDETFECNKGIHFEYFNAF